MKGPHQIWPGLNAEVQRTAQGTRLDGDASLIYRHPWYVDCEFESTDDGKGEWRARVNPGFVNASSAFIDMPAAWLADKVASGAASKEDFGIDPLTNRPFFDAWVFKQGKAKTGSKKAAGPGGPIRITNHPAPYLSLTGWRDPISSSGVSVDDSGELIYGAGEGYPDFFTSLGVTPPAAGGKTPDAPFDPLRTCQLRGLDIVLTQPRPGSALDITQLNPLIDGFDGQISTTYTTAYYDSTGGRPRLTTTAKFTPLDQQWIDSPFLGLPMNSGDPQMDQLLIATVWMVSPPETGSDAQVDQTWQPYVQHFVFWNLAHATRFIPPPAPLPPIRIVTGLGLGLLDFLANAFIAPLNDAMNEANAFLNASDMRGQFWNI